MLQDVAGCAAEDQFADARAAVGAHLQEVGGERLGFGQQRFPGVVILGAPVASRLVGAHAKKPDVTPGGPKPRG